MWCASTAPDRVVQIVTFGTLAARGVLRDVGRVMDLPYAFVDTIAKMVPTELNITLDKALAMNPELKKLYEEDSQVRELVDMSKRLEGLPRHTSMHAAGVVISQKAVDEYVPLSLGSDGSVTTQFTMTTLEELGLLKMDFLGLRTLTVIQNAVELAQKSTGKEIDIHSIDYNDKEVLDSIGTGKTDGVFQLESTGMKGFMKELKPPEPGGYHCRDFPVPARPHGLYPPVYQGKKQPGADHLRLPPAGADPGTHLRGALSTRSRLCRSSGIWPATPWDEATFCAAPCPRKREM